MPTILSRSGLWVTSRRYLNVDRRNVAIPQLRVGLDVSAIMEAHVQARRKAGVILRIGFSCSITKRSTLSPHLVRSEQRIVWRKRHLLAKVFPRLSGFQIYMPVCTSLKIGLTSVKKADLEYQNRSSESRQYMSCWQTVELFSQSLSAQIEYDVWTLVSSRDNPSAVAC